jgi:hypothetical protein
MHGQGLGGGTGVMPDIIACTGQGEQEEEPKESPSPAFVGSLQLIGLVG